MFSRVEVGCFLLLLSCVETFGFSEIQLDANLNPAEESSQVSSEPVVWLSFQKRSELSCKLGDFCLLKTDDFEYYAINNKTESVQIFFSFESMGVNIEFEYDGLKLAPFPHLWKIIESAEVLLLGRLNVIDPKVDSVYPRARVKVRKETLRGTVEIPSLNAHLGYEIIQTNSTETIVRFINTQYFDWTVNLKVDFPNETSIFTIGNPLYVKRLVIPFRYPGTESRTVTVLRFSPKWSHVFNEHKITLSKVNYGNVKAVPDLDYPYSFPFRGEKLVVQGNNVSLSHNSDISFYAFDFRMEENSVVYAARKGIVAVVIEDQYLNKLDVCPADNRWCDEPGSDANSISILHLDGTVGVYEHLIKDGATVEVGTWVEVGDPIALSGNTGFSIAPHLHFAVHKNVKRGIDSALVSVPLFFGDCRNDCSLFAPQSLDYVNGSCLVECTPSEEFEEPTDTWGTTITYGTDPVDTMRPPTIPYTWEPPTTSLPSSSSPTSAPPPPPTSETDTSKPTWTFGVPTEETVATVATVTTIKDGETVTVTMTPNNTNSENGTSLEDSNASNTKTVSTADQPTTTEVVDSDGTTEWEGPEFESPSSAVAVKVTIISIITIISKLLLECRFCIS